MQIQLNWSVTLTKEEDNNGDDPVLQFVFLTTNGGAPIAFGQRTEQLASSTGLAAFQGRITPPGGGESPPPTFGGIQIPPLTPTEDDPYFGFIIRGIEQDNSKTSDRNRDFGRMVQAVQDRADAESGGLELGDLWTSVNNLGLINRAFRDDDDKIGVSGRVYPNYGTQLAAAARGVPEGTLLEDEIQLESLTLLADNARWDMNVTVRPFA